MESSNKSMVLRALLEQGNVYLHLDPSRPGVVVPSYFKDDQALTLVVGPNLAIPIPDLEIGAEGLSATLSFSRQPFHCEIPWSALFAMTTEDGRSLVWTEDAPESLRQALIQETSSGEKGMVDPSSLFGVLGDDDVSVGQDGNRRGRKRAPDRSRFSVVEGGQPASSDGESEGAEDPSQSDSTPYLHLVD